MSLLEQAFEKYTILNKSIISDGYGGTSTVWTDGAEIDCAVVYNNSTQMIIAQASGVSTVYTITVKKNVELDYHTVLKRKSDGKIFRITTNSDELKTPDSATLNMRQYNAEEWKLP